MNFMGKPKKRQCRTCYNATKGLRLLTNQTKCGDGQKRKSYAELLQEVSSINITDDAYKELPQFICNSCSCKLKASHAFIRQSRKINERLLTMILSQKETNIQVDCLQEAQVDIQSCLEIKMEHSEPVAEKGLEVQFDVELKLEETEEITHDVNYLNACDISEAKDYCEIDSVELINLRTSSELKTDSTNRKEGYNEDILNIESEKNDDNLTNSKKDKNLLKSKDTASDIGNYSDYEDNLLVDTECQNENRDYSSNNKKDEKKIRNKNKIFKDTTKKLSEDDVAVPCSQCSKIFNNSKALLRHQRTSHIPEDQKCTCPLCFRKFSRSCNMYTHMRTFHGPDTVPLIRKPSTQERSFQCDKCPRNYTKKKHLNIHIKNKHNQEYKNKEISTEDKRDTCYVTSDKSIKPKRYEVRSLCSICGSSFSSKTHLIVHMRRHTGERPFKCDLCERAYPRISELTCHRRIHTGEKPFACKICGKTFRVSSKMTTHMRSHTDIRPYKCTQCERSFKYSKDLSIHFRIHTGERPYCCEVCGSTFTQSNTLKAHRVKLGHMDNVFENTNNLI